ncbi:MAG: arylesterase [Mariprofundaceae bacterium]|nr:arylesterase [Mariprofundaceae bacterium]
MLIRSLLCLSLCCIPWLTQASTITKKCNILVLGDSLSAAFGIATKEGWVHLLKMRLKERESTCGVVNASVSGETTQGGRARLPALLQQHQPSYLILELGANNGLRALPVDRMQKDLSSIIETAQSVGIHVLLVGMLMPPNYGPIYTQQFASVYQSLVHEYKTPFVPFLLEGVITKPAWMQADALHPNAKAQSTMLNLIWNQLQPMIK